MFSHTHTYTHIQDNTNVMRRRSSFHPHQNMLDVDADDAVSEDLARLTSRNFSIRNSEGKNLARNIKRVRMC